MPEFDQLFFISHFFHMDNYTTNMQHLQDTKKDTADIHFIVKLKAINYTLP